MEKKSLHLRLSEIQKELRVPKSQFNAFSNFNYRSCEDILEAIKPLLKDLILVINDEIVQVGERYYVKATAMLYDEKDCIQTSAFARESLDKKGMDDSQITGSTSSYARKYALNGLFAIDDTKDADTQKPAEKKVVKDLNEGYKNPLKCEICGATGIYHKPSCPNYKKIVETHREAIPNMGVDGKIG